MSTLDPVTTSQWGLALFKWLGQLPETIKAWGQLRRRPAVSIVPLRHAMYHEATQPDGTIVSQIAFDCLITNGREDCSLLIARTECHVRAPALGPHTAKNQCAQDLRAR